MMSTVDYFYLLGWIFVGLILLVWLAKPPFGPGRRRGEGIDRCFSCQWGGMPFVTALTALDLLFYHDGTDDAWGLLTLAPSK